MDTQNKLWAEDKGKFGYRMLQKMGWSEGKGLGVKEDGSTSHIRVRKNVSQAGIGAGAAARDAWKVPGKVAEGLDDVLARLSQSAVASGAAVAGVAGVTPEKRLGGRQMAAGKPRKATKGRGFLERRMQGKNVGCYSESALREIFGGAELGKCAAGDPGLPGQEVGHEGVEKSGGSGSGASKDVRRIDPLDKSKKQKKKKTESDSEGTRKERKAAKAARKEKRRIRREAKGRALTVAEKGKPIVKKRSKGKLGKN